MGITCTGQVPTLTHISSGKEQPGSPAVERQGGGRREEEERRGEKKTEDYQYMNQFTDKDFQTTGV